MIVPMAAAAATAAPETAPNSELATTLVWARPPGARPTSTMAASMRRPAMPPWFMMTPARMKNGIASSVKLLMPVKISAAVFIEATPTSP